MPISLQDIYEPPWLRSDPSGQGLMQGIALGQAVLEGQARRQQMQQAADRFPVMMEGLRLQNEATREGLPLELEQIRLGNQLKQQAQALNTVQLQNMTEAQKLQAQREASMGELARTMSTISGQGLWGTETADTFISGLGVRAPWLIASPEWKAISGMQENAKQERAKVEADKAKADLQREIWGVRTTSAKEIAQMNAERTANRIANDIPVDPEDRRESDMVRDKLKDALMYAGDDEEKKSQALAWARNELYEIRRKREERNAAKSKGLQASGSVSTNAPIQVGDFKVRIKP